MSARSPVAVYVPAVYVHPVTTAPPFKKLASSPGLLCALDAGGFVWTLVVDGCSVWHRLTSPAAPAGARVVLVDLSVASPGINGPWTAHALDLEGRAWVRVHAFVGGMKLEGWGPWARVTDRSDPVDEGGEQIVEAPPAPARRRSAK